MKLYYSDILSSHRACAVARYVNAPVEYVYLDFAKGEHKAPAHLARQPFGQIPAIDDDGFSFYESRAICRYINERVGGGLVPTDIKGRALMEQWISVETSNFTPHAMNFGMRAKGDCGSGGIVPANAVG